MERILQILTECRFKGKFVQRIKAEGLWHLIVASSPAGKFTDAELVYLFLNPDQILTCPGNFPRKYLGLSRGYNHYCSTKSCEYCTSARISASKDGLQRKYGVDNSGRLPNAVANHRAFLDSEERMRQASEKRKVTNLKTYGHEHVFASDQIKKQIKETVVAKYGVDNISKVDAIKREKEKTCLQNYGVPSPLKSEEIKNRIKNTSLQRYGKDFPMQSSEIKDKMMHTKINTGAFTRSNVSKEATAYFRKYAVDRGYSATQVAYADPESGLHEWGYYFDRWYLFDFVAFREGHRGNPNEILEIVEYHGPFHYTQQDVVERGSDKAVPWKSNTMTISESVDRDTRKEYYARSELTDQYTVVWSEKYHKRNKK